MGAEAGIVIITPEGIRLEHSFKLGFKASNNEAEYEAFLAGLRAVLRLGTKDVEIYSDSRLVVYQTMGYSSIAKLSGPSTAISALRTSIQLRHTLKVTAKLRQ